MMRPNQQNNKNRSRGRNNNNGRKPFNPLSRNFESNGPDVKVRGNAAHIAEKYVQLARDAQASGDSVMAENYYQHAEHYFRIVSAAQPQGVPRPDQFGQDSDGYDEDGDEMMGGDSMEPHARIIEEQPQRDQQQGRDNQQQGRDNQQQPRGDRQFRGDRRDNGERGERFNGNDRSERFARNGERNERPDAERPVPAEAAPEPQAPVPAMIDQVQPEVPEPAEMAVAAETPENSAEPVKRARRPRRPRRTAEGADEAASGEGGDLPAFITAGTQTAAE